MDIRPQEYDNHEMKGKGISYMRIMEPEKGRGYNFLLRSLTILPFLSPKEKGVQTDDL